MLIQEPVQAAVWHCLNHYAYVDATFLAERLHAEVDSEEVLHLLATTYYRSGKTSQAYNLLRLHGYSTPQLKYLMAKCCYDLGKFDEAEITLTGSSVLKPKQIDELVIEFGAVACFALQLLGLICVKTERLAKGAEALRRSLKLNPFLWHSFASLCDFGDKPDPLKVFNLDTIESFSNIHGHTIYSLFNSEINSSVQNTDSVTTSNKLSNVSINTPIDNIHQNSSPSINHMQNIHMQHQTPIITPQICPPNKILNAPLISTCQNISFFSTPVSHSLAVLNTPLSTNSTLAEPLDSLDGSKMKKVVRFQRFLSTSNVSPISPSFGVLPLDNSNQWHDSISSHNSSVALLTPSPLSLSQKDSLVIHKIDMNIRKRFPSQILGRNFQSPATGQSYVRRSSRLFSNNSSVKENNKNRFVAPKSPARKTKSRVCKTQSSLCELNEKNKDLDIISASEKSLADKPCVTSQNLSQQAFSIQKQCSEGLMKLLRHMGSAYFHLSQYNCSKVVEFLRTLPPQHYRSGWVLSHLGKAFFELNDYKEAERYFAEVRQKEPYSFHLMDIYSTTLWHLQKEVALSALAQDLVEIDRNSPEAWCATGNCFSLQREHEAAIKFFSRAIQVDPEFAYAYTLLGHEYLATEELDKALSCYRSAARINPRHYNSWYGIGLVLFKQERFSQAEWYFKKAANIHGDCSVLLCHIAVVEHTLQKSDAALKTLSKALEIDQRNPLCKYHKASILHSLDRNEESLREILELKEIVPKESNVYFLLGKVYKRLGETHLALMNFSWAMDLDPKDANNQFKETIDPAINCFSAEDDENTNNNPEENLNSESNISSALGADSSQESLVLPSLDLDRFSPLEDHFNTFISSSSVLSPHASASSSFTLAATTSNTGSSLIHQSSVLPSVTETVPPPSPGSLSTFTPSYSLLSSNSSSNSTVTPLNNSTVSMAAEIGSVFASSSSFTRNSGSRYGLAVSRSSPHVGTINNLSGRLSLTTSEPGTISSVSHGGLMSSLTVSPQNLYSAVTQSNSSIQVADINTISSSIAFLTPRPSVRFSNSSNTEARPNSRSERARSRNPSDDNAEEIL